MIKEKQIEIGDVLEGRISCNQSGSAYLVSTELPKDIYIHSKNTNKALHLDNVKVEIIAGIGRSIEGRVIEIVERFRTEFVGVIQISDKHAFFISDSNKVSTDFFIPLDKLNGATDGQKVVAKITEWKETAKNPNAEIVRVLGDAGEHETEIHSILEEYGLPYDFEADVIAEANIISTEITQAEIDKRRDMRDVLTFTIDPADAKDFDDALSVEWVNGELYVGIHIADVSHYLRPDTELDKEAYNRGTSVYLVDRCVPMLPENLSNGLCSLRPLEDKLCFSAVFKLDNRGKVVEEWFGKTVINSDHRFTYEDAQLIIENKESFMSANELGPLLPTDSIGSYVDRLSNINKCYKAIRDLNRYAQMMRKERFKRGSISLDKQEVRFKLDENNKPKEIVIKQSKDSNKLIEEFMLLANRHVAQFINKKELPNVNRAHEKPNEEKLAKLKNFVAELGYVIKTDTPEDITRSLNALLLEVHGKPEENMIESLVVRTMQKAIYTTRNPGHYGLGFQHYSHFTSPIRRYPDVIVHRLLNIYLDGYKAVPKLEKLETRCAHLSEREKRAQKAERESIKFMQCVYMSEHINKVFKGVVTSITDYGVFVELEGNHCEGLVKMTDIKGTWSNDGEKHRIKEYNTGETISLGDEVSVIVSSVDIEKKNINLSIIRF